MLRQLAQAIVPPKIRPAAVETFYRLRAPFYAGNRFECPCCGGRFRKFLSLAGKRRLNVMCPRCGSKERDRLLWLFVRERTNLFDAKQRLLHVAPERIWERAFRRPGVDYVSIDLDSPLAMVRMDLTDLRFEDASFDAVFCHHVLEHVPDDRKAMREMLRVTKPGGIALLLSYLDPKLDRTDEDPTLRDPVERTRRFGQPDHVRVYGRDYADRLRESGWEVEILEYFRELPVPVRERHALLDDDIYLCRRPA